MTAQPSDESQRLRAARMESLVLDAQTFLRAGGTLSWSEWRRMDVDTRAAFAAANDALKVEHALRTATALSGPEGALSLHSELDGGDLAVDVALQAAVARLAAKGRK